MGPEDLLAVLLSAAGVILAFPLPDLGFIAWVALVPLFLVAHRRPPGDAFRLGYLWGLAAYGGVLWWMTAFGLVVWALAAAFAALAPAAAMLAIAWVERDRDGPFIVLWIPLVWTAVEFLRSQGALGIPWALLGATQHRAPPVIQIASVGGVYAVSFLVALVNVALYVILTRRAVLAPAAGAGVVLAAALLYGVNVLRHPVPATFTAAVVQPGVAGRAQAGPGFDRRRFEDLGGLTHQAAARGAALIVWPETASPADILDPRAAAAIRSWVRRDHVSLIASSLEGGRANSAFAFGPTGALLGRYDKVRLVPFAEYGERPGRARTVLRTPEAAIGIAICYESIFPDIARQYARRGATMLAVLTNDAWFGGRAAPAQHAALAPFRAVEERRYLLRAANEGISAIIDPRGRTVAGLRLGARGILTARVAPLSGLTPYARYGDVFGWAAVLATAALLLPRSLGFLAEEAGTGVFPRLLAQSALPFLGLAAAERLRGPAPIGAGPVVLPAAIVALLAVTALLSLGHPARALGFRLRSFVPAAAAGLAAVAALTLIARHAFAAHGPAPPLLTPVLQGPHGTRWAATLVRALAVGLAFEWWLRGLVFAAAAGWRGEVAAVLWPAFLGMAAASLRGPEAMAWGLCGGVIFGAIRARWAQIPALAVAHAAGAILLGFLFSPW